MKVTMYPQPIEIGRFSMKLRDPGAVRHVAFTQKQELVMSVGAPSFREVPIIFVELSPDLPVRTRDFVCIRQGEVFDIEDDERADYCASGVAANGMVVHVFEVVKTKGKGKVIEVPS